MPKPYRLRLPGPTTVPERVRNALAKPVVNHRGPEFGAVVKEIESHLRKIMGTANPVLLFAASGTGVMEASLANTLGTGDRALFLSNGQFAERFAAIAKGLNLQADSLEVPWGKSVNPALLAARLAETDYQAVIAIHNESSTGAVADLEAIGAVVRGTPAVLIVDSVSGLGGIDMQQDRWGVDILLSASQKALMCPPGLGLISVSEKAWKIIDGNAPRARFYWDFRKARDNAVDGQTAFTPAVSLGFGLCEALRMIDEEGLPNVLARHERLAAALQAGGAALGLPVFTKSPIRSNTVTVLQLPEGKDAGSIVRHLYENYGTVIAGARNKLDGTVIRFGTMGYVDDADIILDLMYLERTLLDLGWPVVKGAALAAANESFSRT
ncbi:MAG: aminotransferase class V-fold PLP-dependent enzyme [Alphaproteobacteria bacterium]|nr:aminotransferase class V-fold PLP-dependent enzyme [Alphaproteobacteria bacterium]